MSDDVQDMREIIKLNNFVEKEKIFECVINKSATLTVIAKDENHAYREACAVLDGDKGWSEYANDGWEVIPECIEEVKHD